MTTPQSALTRVDDVAPSRCAYRRRRGLLVCRTLTGLSDKVLFALVGSLCRCDLCTAPAEPVASYASRCPAPSRGPQQLSGGLMLPPCWLRFWPFQSGTPKILSRSRRVVSMDVCLLLIGRLTIRMPSHGDRRRRLRGSRRSMPIGRPRAFWHAAGPAGSVAVRSCVMRVRTAACACGQLRVICDDDPELVSLCHCLACQRRHAEGTSDG